MIKQSAFNKTFLTVLTATILSACDSGGSNGTPNQGTKDTGEVDSVTIEPTQPDPVESEPEVILTGQFIDSPVQGLYYETPSQSGLTNENGEFNYIEGETISFHIGGTKLGSAAAGDQLTPFNLSGIQPFTAENKILKSLSSNKVNGFDRAVNIANLLQNLDADGNPDNGIDLNNAHKQLAGETIDISEKAVVFTKALASSDLLKNLDISTHRSLSEVLSHLYDNLNLSIESSQVSSFESSSGHDNSGNVSYEYNEDGIVTSQNIDTDNDGISDAVTSFEYDQNGNLTRKENSQTKQVELMYYNGQNQLVGRSISSPKTGNSVTEVLSYSDNQLSRLEVSHENKTQISSYSYDANNKLSAVLIDNDDNGENDQKFEYKYVNGQISSFVEDKDNDGQTDLGINYGYDENGNRTTHKIDTNQDGQVDLINTFTYDTNNHLVRYEQDKNLDGIADYIEDYIHDVQGNRTRYRKDNDANGTWDFIAHYTYDDNGRRTQMVEDSDGNGLADKVWNRSYQASTSANSWARILELLL